MDKALLKRAAIQSLALMLAVISFSYALRQYQTVIISASNISAADDVKDKSTNTKADIENNDKRDDSLTLGQKADEKESGFINPLMNKYLNDTSSDILDELGSRFLIIKKPKGNNINFQMEDLYITKSIQITLSGLADDEISKQDIFRVFEDNIFTGDPTFKEFIQPVDSTGDEKKEPKIIKDFGKDIVHGITITNEYDTSADHYTTKLLIELDNVYAQILYEDHNYYYIDLKSPKEVYNKILVIDAGHGGKDGGALSKGEKYYEKNINLDILLKVKELLEQENIKVYYTRTEDNTVFLRPRVELANAVDCDYFISIHCNANEVSWPNGTEIYYYDAKFKEIETKDLANLILDEIGNTTSLKKREIVQKTGDDIFILKNAVVPAILIEVGYLTNTSDMNYLSKSDNRQEVAQGIYNGIMKAYETFSLTKDIK